MKAVQAVVLALAALASCAQAQSIADVLNFALQLEYLEAQFYSCASTGQPISSSLTGNPGGQLIGCQKANLDTETAQYAAELTENELTHVEFLRTALGSAAVPQPTIDIGPAFAAAANAAAGMTLSPPFSPYTNSLFFLHGAYIFEPVGATAYLGAAPLLVSNATVLSAAAGIYGVEAVHTGIVDTLLYQQATTELPYNVTVAEFIEAIASLENKVNGNSDAQGITAISNGQEVANLVPVNENAMIFARTPAQVLSIVTLGSTTGAGGFFPNGLNGFFAPSAPAPAPVTSSAG